MGRASERPGERPHVVDVLEFNSGLMISIDETVDEPNWLRYTERVADFSRLIRFDAGGLGLSDPLPTGTESSIEGWGRDALAVMDAAGCDRAVVLASAGGAMAALWLAATHPERVISLVIVNGTARVGQAEDYGFGASDEEVAVGSGIEGSMTEDGIPRDISHLRPQPGPPGRLPGVVGPGGPPRRQPGDRHGLQPRHLLRRPALVASRRSPARRSCSPAWTATPT